MALGLYELINNINKQIKTIYYKIENLQPGGGGGVPLSREITINGITKDLSADRSWTISGGGSNIFNSDGTLTGNRILTGANYNLTFSNINDFIITAQTGNSLKVINNDPLYESAVAIQNLSTSATSLTALQFNNRNGVVRASFGYYPDNYWNVPLRNALYFANIYEGIVFTCNSGTVGGLSNGKDIIFQTVGSTPTNQMMIFGPTGNVGINTNTDLGFKLGVAGNARITNHLEIQTADAQSVRITGASVTQNTTGASSGNYLKIRVNGVDYLLDLRNVS